MTLTENNPKTTRSLRDRLKSIAAKWYALSRKKRIAIGVGLGVLLVGIIGVIFLARGSTREEIVSQPEDNGISIAPPEKPANKELPLDGAVVTQDEYDAIMRYLPMAVMVENIISVRPVSGLSRADLVFEAMVEGSITRYMAVFLHHDVDEIMPVRSARSYYLDWVAPLDATYMHIGGAISSDPRINALSRITADGVKSYMNIYGSWWRRNDRFAPHNAFTSTSRMKDAQTQVGWSGPTQLKPWQFKEDAVANKRPESGRQITLEWGSRGQNGYDVRWVYDAIGNRYFYEIAGARQVDPATNEDVTAKNIVMQFTSVVPAFDRENHVIYTTVGSGRALIFQDGDVIEATWTKPNVNTRTTYKNSEGKEVQFNRGKTWIQVVPDDSIVRY